MKFLLDIGIIKLKREGKDEVPRTGYEVLEAGRYF
jgi:predicted transcriptional regulator